jgi:hypothetical protein
MKCFLICWAAVLLCSIAIGGHATAPNLTAEQGSRFALLVGVQKYPKLAEKYQLAGCANDVREFQRLLIERFGFRKTNIVTLIDEQATGDAIRRELNEMRNRVKALPDNCLPAQVIFHFSGHGSQLPDQKENPDEEDGYDETILPCNAKEFGSDCEIRDDELGEFAKAVCASGRARLWAVLDCCHSGTGFRGGTTKIRCVYRGNGADQETMFSPKRDVPQIVLPDGAVTLSACRDCEAAPEYEEGGKSYGLLTRHLIQVLYQRSDLAYDLLPDAIMARCRQSGVALPFTPQLDGSRRSLQASVCGEANSTTKCAWKATRTGADPSTVRLDAGSFHGVTVGSRYEMYASPEDISWQPTPNSQNIIKPSLGWLEIEDVKGATALARFFRWADAKRTAQETISLPEAFRLGYAVERYHQSGDFGIRLRIVRTVDRDTDGPSLSQDDRTIPVAIREGLAGANHPDESKWLHLVDGDTACDYLLRIAGHYAAIFPATGMTGVTALSLETRNNDIPDSLRGGWGPFDLNSPDKVRMDLPDALRRIARARNLLRLTAIRDSVSHSPMEMQIEVGSVKVSEYDQKTQKYKAIEEFSPVTSDQKRVPTLKEDQMFAFRVTNREKSDKPVFITVLSVGPNMEIDVLWPKTCSANPESETHQLLPGKDFITNACDGVDTPGAYYTVVLATRKPSHFERLTQPGLFRTKGPSELDGDASLEEVLLEQTFFQARAGGRTRPVRVYDDSWSATVLKWEAIRHE